MMGIVKLWTNPILLFAAAFWAVAFLWMVINVLRAPLAVEGKHGLRLLKRAH